MQFFTVQRHGRITAAVSTQTHQWWHWHLSLPKYDSSPSDYLICVLLFTPWQSTDLRLNRREPSQRQRQSANNRLFVLSVLAWQTWQEAAANESTHCDRLDRWTIWPTLALFYTGASHCFKTGSGVRRGASQQLTIIQIHINSIIWITFCSVKLHQYRMSSSADDCFAIKFKYALSIRC